MEFLLEVLLWLFFTSLPGILAHYKGRDVLRWGFFGCMIPIIPILIILFLPPLNCHKCPYCASKIPDEATVCRFCHREV